MKITTLVTIPALWLLLASVFALAACDATAPPSPEAPTDSTAREVPPDTPIAEVLAESDPFTRIRRLAAQLPQLGPERVPEVRRVLQMSQRGTGTAEIELLMRYWATHEPEAATQWAFGLPENRFRLSAISAAVERWAHSDPEAAVAAVAGWTQSGDAEVARTTQLALVYGWFQKDRETLISYIQGLGTSIERQRAALGYALALGQADGSQAVMEWAEAVPEDDPRWKLTVYRQVTSALARLDTKAAERWCEAQCEGPYGKAMRSVLIRVRLAYGEPGIDVVGWAAEAPESSRARALRIAWQTWARRDREKAMAWMEAQISEDGKPKETWVPLLYGAYARQLSVNSPAEALVWAERMQNEAREETSVRIARRWLKLDPEAAEAWIADSWLSDEAKARALNLSLPTYLPDPDVEEDLETPERSARETAPTPEDGVSEDTEEEEEAGNDAAR